ncbi:Antirestriction protein [Polaromonas sp. OV174]|uniref:antirestriction protein n=1 Tax=Polaromonas sp. OV174 TaxID=1855300 RepID=UPI0008E240D2|nr:antirestriction protein [Polaromonas sp. OV174]SFC17506.1 Antirestriction protein [Polaromonas sp. OV174]
MTNTIIHRQLLTEARRVKQTSTLFGIHFPMQLEPTAYAMAGRLSPDYSGGDWAFCALENGGFYIAPRSNASFKVYADNGFSGALSGDALGITACLYAYSQLSFGDGEFADMCAQQYHWLRDYMLVHAEARAIVAAID